MRDPHLVFDPELWSAAQRDSGRCRAAYIAAVQTNGSNEALLEPLRRNLVAALVLRDMARGDGESAP